MMSKHLQGILAELLIGIVGYFISAIWGKATGRDLDGDTYRFLAIMWGSIVAFGMLMLFVM